MQRIEIPVRRLKVIVRSDNLSGSQHNVNKQAKLTKMQRERRKLNTQRTRTATDTDTHARKDDARQRDTHENTTPARAHHFVAIAAGAPSVRSWPPAGAGFVLHPRTLFPRGEPPGAEFVLHPGSSWGVGLH